MSEDEVNGRYNNSTTNTGRQNVVVNINTDPSVTERKDKIDDVKGDITKQISLSLINNNFRLKVGDGNQNKRNRGRFRSGNRNSMGASLGC